MATTAEDQARLLVTIEATQVKFEKQLARIAKAAGDAAKKVEDDFKKANDNVAGGFDKGGREAERGLNRTRAAAANLSFQLNDIATGLAAGTSPFTIMAQQGGQVAQIMQQVTAGGAGVKGAIGALTGAVTGLLNPVSLASVALIGVTGVAVQFFTNMVSGGKDSEETLKEQNKLIDQMRGSWEDTLPALDAYLKKLEETEKRQQSLNAATLKINQMRDKAADAVGIDSDVVGLLNQLSSREARDLETVFAEINQEIKSGTASLEDFGKAQGLINQLNVSKEFRAQLNEALAAARAAYEEAKGGSEALAKAQDDNVKAQYELAGATKQLSDAYGNSQTAGENAFKGIREWAVKIYGEQSKLVEQLDKMKAGYDEVSAKAIQAINEAGRLQQLPPLTSGGGQVFVAGSEEEYGFQSNQSAYQQAGASAAADMVRGFEGFISKAKWDVNAFRVGFGSDTITRANGEVVKVTQDTVTTLADAQRDLSRRLVEFQNGIQRAVGPETWASLNEGQRAALTSIAYNYGSLPKRIVEAIQRGGGPEAVAQAINALGSDNAGVNANRRRREAEAYLSGSGFSLKDAGISSGGAEKLTPDQKFEKALEASRQRIAMYGVEAEAQRNLTQGMNDYGYAVEYAKEKQRLLNEAKQAGLPIDDALKSKIEAQATALATAASEGEKFKATTQQLTEAQKQLGDIAKTALNGIANALQDGKITGEEWLQIGVQIIQQLLQMKSAANGIGGGGLFGGGGGGLLGGLLIPGILHSGGVAGVDGYGSGRAVSPSVFSGAKRYHRGGVAGLQPGEVPAILQRGEVVLPKGMKSRGSSQDRVDIVLNDPSGMMAGIADRVIQSRAGTIVRLAVQKSQAVTRANMGNLIAEGQNKQL